MNADLMAVDVSEDWIFACDVQERFMQAAEPTIPTLAYAAQCRQLRALGGDCFDFLALPGHRMGLAIADASGKGLAAALMMANVQSSLRTAAWFAPHNPIAAVEAVNRQVHASSAIDRYATLFYGLFHEDTRILEYVNAGHNPPLVIRGGVLSACLETGGPPVGMLADSVYRAGMVELKPGDRIVAYTDGIIEAVDASGEEWGVHRLFSIAAADPTRPPDEIVRAAFAALEEFSGQRQRDDATLLVAEVR